MDAITLITADHRKIAELFARYRASMPTDPARVKIVRDFTRELTAHAAAEEQVMYPEARRVVEDGVIVDDARSEHREIRHYLADLESLDWRTPQFEETVTKLIGCVEQHVADEERTILPALRDGVTATGLEEMGVLMEQARRTAPKRPPTIAKSTSLLLSDAADAAMTTARKAVSAVTRAIAPSGEKTRTRNRRKRRSTMTRAARARTTPKRATSGHKRRQKSGRSRRSRAGARSRAHRSRISH
jgi:hemerythrin superfamily protein